MNPLPETSPCIDHRYADNNAQDRGRAVNAPHVVALVRAGATFVGGQLVERPADTAAA
jgi:hypothetical protein